jgi:hypothetical protein
MTLFLILVNFIAALVSVQFLRGDLSAEKTMNFGTLFNAFLAMYQVRLASCIRPGCRYNIVLQVFSSENWTDILYATAGAEKVFGQSVIAVIFVAGWMLFANCASFASPYAPLI